MMVVGEYNRHGYRVVDAANGQCLALAGNSPVSGTTVLEKWDRYAVPLHTIKGRCERAAREIAEEEGAAFGGVERIEEE